MPSKPVAVSASLMLTWITMGLIWQHRITHTGRQHFSFQRGELIEAAIMVALTVFAMIILFREKLEERKLQIAFRREKFREIGEAIKVMREVRQLSRKLLAEGFRIDMDEVEKRLEQAGKMLDSTEVAHTLEKAYEAIRQTADIITQTRDHLLEPAQIKNSNDLRLTMIDARIERLTEDLRDGLRDLSTLKKEIPNGAAIITLQFNRVASLMGKIADRRKVAGEQNGMEIQQFSKAAENITVIFEMLGKFHGIVSMPRQVLEKTEIAKNQFPRLLGSISFIMENLEKRGEEYQNIAAAVEEGKSLIGAANGSDWLTGYRILLASYEQIIELAKEEGMEVEEIPNLVKIDQTAH